MKKTVRSAVMPRLPILRISERNDPSHPRTPAPLIGRQVWSGAWSSAFCLPPLPSFSAVGSFRTKRKNTFRNTQRNNTCFPLWGLPRRLPRQVFVLPLRLWRRLFCLRTVMIRGRFCVNRFRFAAWRRPRRYVPTGRCITFPRRSEKRSLPSPVPTLRGRRSRRGRSWRVRYRRKPHRGHNRPRKRP